MTASLRADLISNSREPPQRLDYIVLIQRQAAETLLKLPVGQLLPLVDQRPQIMLRVIREAFVLRD